MLFVWKELHLPKGSVLNSHNPFRLSNVPNKNIYAYHIV